MKQLRLPDGVGAIILSVRTLNVELIGPPGGVGELGLDNVEHHCYEKNTSTLQYNKTSKHQHISLQKKTNHQSIRNSFNKNTK